MEPEYCSQQSTPYCSQIIIFKKYQMFEFNIVDYYHVFLFTLLISWQWPGKQK